MDPDEGRALEAGVSLDDLVGDADDRAPERLSVQQVRSACAGAATSHSFPASLDRVKGARQRLAGPADGVYLSEQTPVEPARRARRHAQLLAEEDPQPLVDAQGLGDVPLASSASMSRR